MMLLCTSAHNSFESKAEFITIFFVFIVAQKNKSNCVLCGKSLNVLSRDYCKPLSSNEGCTVLVIEFLKDGMLF